MKRKLSRKEASNMIEDFFKQKGKLDSKKVRKIKRLAMLYNIRLSDNRKRFCNKCLCDLKDGKVRVTKFFKNVECRKCKNKNKWKIKKRL